MRSLTAVRGSVAVLAVVLLAGAGRTAALQSGGQSSSGSGQQGMHPPSPVSPNIAEPGTEGGDPYTVKMAAAQARAMRDDRHKKLVEDTAKLVELSNELKTEVDKASKDDLSLTVIKKAGDIEKLAHDVKERMKN